MRFDRATVTVAALLIPLVSACSQSTDQPRKRAEPSEPKAGATVADHAAPHWSYEGEAGPAHWASLSEEWSPCGGGRSQSPIDIDATAQTDLPPMTADFAPAQMKIIHHAHVADAINNGHTIQVNYTEGDVLSVGAESFQLVQYHFHSPSEHTVGGRHYPMEMHLVHRSAEGKLAVVGVFIEEGSHNAAFDPIWRNLPATQGTEYHLENVMVDVDELLPAAKTSYRYDGSLTTPPCSEGVKWIIMTTPISLSAEQIGAFQRIVDGNSRPVQPLNGRPVLTDLVATSG